MNTKFLLSSLDYAAKTAGNKLNTLPGKTFEKQLEQLGRSIMIEPGKIQPKTIEEQAASSLFKEPTTRKVRQLDVTI